MIKNSFSNSRKFNSDNISFFGNIFLIECLKFLGNNMKIIFSKTQIINNYDFALGIKHMKESSIDFEDHLDFMNNSFRILLIKFKNY